MSDFETKVIPQDSYDREEICEKVEEYFEDKELEFEDKTVFLKPSFVLPIKEEELKSAADTHNAVTSGVAKALSKKGASRIIIAEHSTVGNARYAFNMVGIKDWVEDIDNVEFKYLDEEECENVQVKDPFIEDHEIKYPKILLDDTVDYFVSLPKLKTNLFAEVTLSAKNNLGLVSKEERLKHHGDDLHENIADITKIRTPDLIIADTIIAGQGQGPQQPDPVNLEMLIASDNCLAADTVCCYVMGIEPEDIEHLELLNSQNIGPIDIEDVEIKNEDYLESKKGDFKLPESELEKSDDMNVYIGEGACKGGCIGMLRAILDFYGLNEGWDSLGELNIIIDDKENSLEIPKEELEKLDKKNTIIMGDCSEKYEEYGSYFSGCPPDYTSGLFKIWLRGPLGKNPLFDSEHVSIPQFLKSYALHYLQKIKNPV